MSRAVRWMLRQPWPVLTLVTAGAVPGLVMHGLPWERRIAVLDSPTHQYRVEVVRSEGGSVCGGQRALLVRVVRHLSTFKLGEDDVLCVEGAGSVGVRWRSATDLEVRCTACDHYQVTERNWGDVRYSFDLQRS